MFKWFKEEKSKKVNVEKFVEKDNLEDVMERAAISIQKWWGDNKWKLLIETPVLSSSPVLLASKKRKYEEYRDIDENDEIDENETLLGNEVDDEVENEVENEVDENVVENELALNVLYYWNSLLLFVETLLRKFF